ncbi:SH3 domain-containing protein [Desulfogranum japonicum]|uniref:SH3 domain-containing protein n=1 Tax=Desulfogranum japonicum TaxID=231447 RepID=UPI000406A62D|nr:SH3 domain-containing protein [Desulfogranum japonicum]
MEVKSVKKWIVTSLTTAAFLGVAALSSSAAEYKSVSKDGINMRSGPGTNYEIIYQLPEGYPLKVLSVKDQWYKVEDYEGDKGWIYGTLLSDTPYVIVKVNEGNVRTGPSTNDSKVGSVARDVILKEVDKKGDWLKVSHPQIEGWVHRSLIWP